MFALATLHGLAREEEEVVKENLRGWKTIH